ncbi:MAG: hypothetical protein NZ585_07220 [Chloracidobacterium sp.]|nr:hypothetical protein [Chloracidobacterium sp.]MDW8217046.1 hypothetical protein [Acidobacteriota bacterium]
MKPSRRAVLVALALLTIPGLQLVFPAFARAQADKPAVRPAPPSLTLTSAPAAA